MCKRSSLAQTDAYSKPKNRAKRGVSVFLSSVLPWLFERITRWLSRSVEDQYLDKLLWI
jgi:hypothetical protein